MLTRGDNHDTDWTKNQNKQKKTLFLVDRRVTSFRTYFFFFLLFFSSHTVIACERAPLWRRCRRSATQRSLRRGTRLPKPISYLQNTTVDRHTVNATTPPSSIGTVALESTTRETIKGIPCTTRSPSRRPLTKLSNTITKIHKLEYRATIRTNITARRRWLGLHDYDDDGGSRLARTSSAARFMTTDGEHVALVATTAPLRGISSKRTDGACERGKDGRSEKERRRGCRKRKEIDRSVRVHVVIVGYV